MVRKMLARAIAWIGLLALCFALPAKATEQLPADIRAQFGSVEITEAAFLDGSEKIWFVLVRTPDRMNRLLCYRLESGTWIQRFMTSDAVPQGEGRISLRMTVSAQFYTDGHASSRPVLEILQYGTGSQSDSVLQRLSFLLSDSGVWTLFHASFAGQDMTLKVEENALTFTTLPWMDRYESHTVEVRIERDLRRVVWEDIPRNMEQAMEIRGQAALE